jgi:hypothetical protein
MSLRFKEISKKKITAWSVQVLPESLPSSDHAGIKPAPTGSLFARNLLSVSKKSPGAIILLMQSVASIGEIVLKATTLKADS